MAVGEEHGPVLLAVQDGAMSQGKQLPLNLEREWENERKHFVP